MYRDESRDPEVHRQQVMADFISDPESLHTKYMGLAARDRRLRKKVEQLEEELAKIRTELKSQRQVANQVPDLTRRLGSAHASLDAYRAESRRLKGDLKRLRASRALRLSRAVTAPFRGTRRSKHAPLSSTTPASPARGELAVAAQTGTADSEFAIDAPESGRAPTATPSTQEKRPSECTYTELKTRLSDRPSPQALGFVLNRAWFAHGLVDEPASLLDSYPDLAGRLTGSSRQLAQRILGARRMRDAKDWVPARACGIAYVAERNRIMYCVHSTPVYNSNGYSTRTRGVTAAMTANGLDVRVVARAGYPWDTKTDIPQPTKRRSVTAVDGVDYVHLTGPHEHHDPHHIIVQQMADAFVREARLYRPSMIQAASNYRTGLAALIAARRLGIPFVYEVRGLWELTEASSKPGWEDSDRYAITKSLETFVATSADHVLAITQEVADVLITRGVDPARISLLPNGVDADQFTPLYPDLQMAKKIAARPLGVDGIPTIGFAGSMVDYEGLDDLLEASHLLHSEGVEHRVVLAGSGPAEPGLHQLAQKHKLEHISFLGRLPASDIPRLMSTIDIVVCPRKSTLITELVSPLKPLEAMASGRAVVISDVAPHHSIVGRDGRRGVLHRAGDAQHLAATLKPLLQDPDARRRLGRHARRWILEARTWAHLGQHIIQAHSVAAASHQYQTASSEMLSLRDIRVAVVADEFTTSTLAAEVEVLSLDRDGWPKQLEAFKPHLVFIESAWAIGQSWHRGVGFYSDEEHADFRALITECRSKNIPTVFWNKEDPVHFNRFVRAAVECDHIFTTDADMIPKYLASSVHARTASTLPFYASPTLHNPLPGVLPLTGGASYAGTFYGSRYAQRSKELAGLLNEAAPFGLTIYDRQADNPESPYKFPPRLQPHVVGSLPYSQVLDAYKAHAANLNVNSVADSPSMFSRRVVEVAASGAVALSAPGRGIVETFGNAIACSDDPQDWRAWLRSWTTSPESRREEAWLQMRAVLRAHTTTTALTLVTRTAGLQVQACPLPEYDVVVHNPSEEVFQGIAAQSVLPGTVHCTQQAGSCAEASLPDSIRVDHSPPETCSGRYLLHVHSTPDRTAAEDLLHATRWGEWAWVATSADLSPDPPYARPTETFPLRPDLTLVAPNATPEASGLALSRPAPLVDPSSEAEQPRMRDSLRGKHLLIAGHDLKFARGLIEAAQAAGGVVSVDNWAGHSQHDPDTSVDLLTKADIVLCEWGLGNAVWYSKHIQPHQRLVVRVHQQELRLDYLRRVRHDNVAQYIFVGRTVLESAVKSHGVPRDRSVVVPNYVDMSKMGRPKRSQDAHFTLGLVGPLPRHKRLDLALDLVQRLHEKDPRFRLRIKGKRPEELPWMRDNATEQEFFSEQTDRIKKMNNRWPGMVRWDPHGDDVADWFTDIGVALSVSDMESFHYTIADGAASGCLPAILAWPGAEYIYPHEWLCADLDEMESRILSASPQGAADIIQQNYSMDVVMPQLLHAVSDGVASDTLFSA